MIDRGIVGIYISGGAVFYVGGPGRTHGKMRLGWTDLGLAGVRLSGLRRGRKLCLRVFLNVRPYTT